jgi:hypothetical protein
MFASRIERIAPERVLLTSRHTARLRVVGTARGFVRCAGERRWVWGRFDHTFVVHGSQRVVTVTVAGLGGWQRRKIEVRARWDLTPPRAPGRVQLRMRRPHAPRLRALSSADLARAEGQRP